MRTLISYFCLAFFLAVAALWSYSLPSSVEAQALKELSQKGDPSTPLAGLIP